MKKLDQALPLIQKFFNLQMHFDRTARILGCSPVKYVSPKDKVCYVKKKKKGKKMKVATQEKLSLDGSAFRPGPAPRLGQVESGPPNHKLGPPWRFAYKQQSL